MDIGQPSLFSQWMAYITQVYKYEYVKTELKLIQNANDIIMKLKRDYPYTYQNHQRYIELLKMFNELENCSSEDVKKLFFKYGLF